MKKSLSVLVILAFACPPALASAALPARAGQDHAARAQGAESRLTNKDVLDMLKAGLTPEIITAKIKTSAAGFDTSAAALQELKAAGVPDEVILAMVQAPAGGAAAAAPQPAPAPVEVKVPDGTEVEIELVNNVSGQEVRVGDLVDFRVSRAVVVAGVTVFERDAPARARITTAKKSGRWGRAGKLEWVMQDVQGADSRRIPARFVKRWIGDSKGGTVALATLASSVFVGPFALLWGLKKGRPAMLPAGTRYTVFVHGDTAVKGKPAPTSAAAVAR